jgi:hypothetical protein
MVIPHDAREDFDALVARLSLRGSRLTGRDLAQ